MQLTKGIILAAGRGERMGTFTQDRPKAMVKVIGKAILHWQVQEMKKAGVQEIYLISGYRSKMLKELGFNCIENSLWEETNMVETLKLGDAILSQGETIISYSDIICNFNIIKKLKSSPGDCVITYDEMWRQLWQERFEDPLEDAETFGIRDGRVFDIGRRTTNESEIQGQYMGLLKLTAKCWNQMKTVINEVGTKKLEMTHLLQKMLERNVPIQGVPISGQWCEIDTPKDLALYEGKLSSKSPWSHDWRG